MLALMLEISRENKYTDGLKIFRSQELLAVFLETRVSVQYGGGEITSSRYLLFIVMFKFPFQKFIN